MRIKTIVICLLLVSCLSCQKDKKEVEGITFDKEKWNAMDGKDYLYRNEMVDDLYASDTLRYLNKQQVIDLLGEPTKIDDLYLFYRILEKRAYLFTLHTKTMVIKLSGDSTANKIMFHE